MKFVRFGLLIIIFWGIRSNSAFSQINLEYLGLSNQQVTSLSVHTDVIVVATDHHGVYRQFNPTPIPTGWTLIGLDTLAVQSVYAHPYLGPIMTIDWEILAGVEFNQPDSDLVYISFDGAPFTGFTQGIQSSLGERINEIDGFSLPNTVVNYYAADGRALYRRALNDTAWTAVYTASIEGNFEIVRVHDEFPGVVLAGGAEGFAGFLLLKSLDYGDTWEDISPLGMVADVDFGGDSAQTIFTTTGQNVYRSMDAGQAWDEIFNGGGWIWITKVIFIPPSTVYIAGGDGLDTSSAILFRSDDMGSVFQQIPLPMAGPINDMDYDTTGWVYFATPDNGVYRFQHIHVGFDDHSQNIRPSTVQLFQNYPNPFNPTTVISWQLAVGSQVELTIYNLLGQEIRKLVNAKQPAGFHKIEWDGKDDDGREVSSGIYFYMLKAGGRRFVNKMLFKK
jgi:hypothetical protein